MTLSKKAIALTGLMTIGALAAIIYAVQTMEPLHDYRVLALLIVSLVTARLKVKLPGLMGNMSVNLPFLLIAVTQFSLFEALLVAMPSCALQCLPKGLGKPRPVQLLFNLSTTAVAMGAANLTGFRHALLAAASFFLAQTIPVAAIISATEGGAIARIWAKIANLSFPFYVLSAGLVSIAASSLASHRWQLPLLCLPVLFAIYRSYESYFTEAKLAPVR